MPVSEQLAKELPYLRRYARALSGTQASGDSYVRNLLEAALTDRELLAQLSAGRVALYRAFNKVWQSAQIEVMADGSGKDPEGPVAERLANMPGRHRQALLLSTLEGFDNDQTAEVLEISTGEAETLIATALSEMAGEPATSVLIIEDEPLIAMQLENLVQDLGHTVSGNAATRTDAVRIFNETRPGLILADVQLADGSSGIDAVEDILKGADVPVIFITAYPEKLLTGERPEPTFLVTKPFREETVRATISQALFLARSNLGR